MYSKLEARAVSLTTRLVLRISKGVPNPISEVLYLCAQIVPLSAVHLLSSMLIYIYLCRVDACPHIERLTYDVQLISRALLLHLGDMQTRLESCSISLPNATSHPSPEGLMLKGFSNLMHFENTVEMKHFHTDILSTHGL
jgi:hypothetical protein